MQFSNWEPRNLEDIISLMILFVFLKTNQLKIIAEEMQWEQYSHTESG